MSGTDYSNPAVWTPDGPYVVLVRPQMGENIGAAARGMWNFGLRRIRIVDPRDGWPNPAAVAMASGAGALLDDARIFPTTAEAVADAQVIYATTARTREMTKRVLTPEAAMVEARGHIDAGRKVAVLFGPERAGLENADVVLADAIISVPVNPAFASLNLAQTVLLMAYEWRRQGDNTPPERLEGEQIDPANAQAVGKLFEYLETELDRAGFFFPDNKKPAMTASLENLLRRAALTDPDVRTLWGVIRALADGPRRNR
ncbi:MAG: RNA methyltransferase [Pseudomonadota bacterium]